ncbi:glycosyltransferase [Aridibaculum aurantiacum]|uniref:glycosyltransferase n=1 Tax=Aridibaculum aurantiacum TaxID=2810307 RepID=UPI001A9756BC|nr:glycosyltransferase [Aridibaculum aurantiacum]
MHILIVDQSTIPVKKYGGTERVIWSLAKELVQMGHKVTFLVKAGSHCDFAKVLIIDETRKLAEQVPPDVDVVHLNVLPDGEMPKPYIVTFHGNINHQADLDLNTVFVSRNHAARFGSASYVHNGLDWNEYPKPLLDNPRSYFHFLGDASWRVKNVKGAIDVITKTKQERLKVLGGHRINFRMGFRLTLSPRVSFAGMVGGAEKTNLLQGSKGLIFPVRWNEPFGLAITESLYMGCPIFGTPYGSLPELVHNDVGFLSNNSTALAQAVEGADAFSRRLCHEYTADVFNSKKMAEAYLEKYQVVMNGGKLNKKHPRLQQVQQEKFLDWK